MYLTAQEIIDAEEHLTALEECQQLLDAALLKLDRQISAKLSRFDVGQAKEWSQLVRDLDHDYFSDVLNNWKDDLQYEISEARPAEQFEYSYSVLGL